MLIFDKEKHFRDLIENGFEKYPNKRDLTCLCEGWLSGGASVGDLKSLIINFCRRWNSKFNYAKSEGLIFDVLSNFNSSKKNEVSFEFCSLILIYNSEIEIIRAIKGKKYQKLAFAMLCLAKWRNVNYIYLNEGSSIHLKDIFSLVGLKDTIKNMNLCLNELDKQGFIDVQLRPIMKCFIPCVVDNGDIFCEFAINEENIMETLLSIVGVKCECCGKFFDRVKNNQKYCKDCGKKMNIAKTVARKKKV